MPFLGRERWSAMTCAQERWSGGIYGFFFCISRVRILCLVSCWCDEGGFSFLSCGTVRVVEGACSFSDRSILSPFGSRRAYAIIIS